MRRNRQISSNSEELSEARFEDKKNSSEFFESRTAAQSKNAEAFFSSLPFSDENGSLTPN
jgi:hypothetical protein